MMRIKWIYVTLFVSFALLIFSLFLAYSDLKKSDAMLKNLSNEHIQLSHYANSLNYAVKNSQAKTLQYIALQKDLQPDDIEEAQSAIHKNIEALKQISKRPGVVSKEFQHIVETLEKRAVGYALVQRSLIDALHENNNKEDIQDALIGFDMITTKFSHEVSLLLHETQDTLKKHVKTLRQSNQKSAQILLYSFGIATLLILVVFAKLHNINQRIARQLDLTEDAQNKLQKAQQQLLEYNENLENEITKKTQELHKKIYTSFLTGLDNRNKLLEENHDIGFTKMAILDIDKFQAFNDVYGEEVGNYALKQTAQWLKEYLENESLHLYHIGGDEFVVASTTTHDSPSRFTELIEKLLNAFKIHTFSYEDKEFQFVMSAGITFTGERKMLAYADMALKDAKKRNVPISIYEESNEFEKQHLENLQIHKKLLYALENDLLISYFQPIVPIKNENLPTKYESLIRLVDQDGTIYPPFKFIDVAKSHRIYHRVSQVVIQNTLKTIAQYSVPCSLNLSLSDIESDQTVNYLLAELDQFAYNKLLTIELLETENFDNYEKVYSFCMKVRSYGVKIALDDFGSGYSNFSHILNLPIDFIKIDATLVSNIDRDISSQIMVETIVSLAKKLNVQTIAEFVATEDILEMVRSLGIDYAQGFHLGKPLPIEEHLA